MDRRETFKLTKSLTTQQIDLTWRAASLSVNNTSKFNIYVHIGTTDKPSSTNFTHVIAPFSSYVADPAGATSFNFFVDNSTDPTTDFNFPIVIEFSTGAAAIQAPLSPSLVAPTSTAYISKLLGVQNGSLIDIWSTFDQPGTNICIDSVSGFRNGIYQNLPTLQGALGPDSSNKVALFNGINQWVNVLTSSLQSVLNFTAGTLLAWIQIPTAKWNDATAYYFAEFRVDGNNALTFRKGAANQPAFLYTQAGVPVTVFQNIVGDSGWWPFVFTWSIPNTRSRIYVKSVLAGPAVLGAVIAGTPASAGLAALSTGGNYLPGSGLFALWTSELQQADVNIVSVAP